MNIVDLSVVLGLIITISSQVHSEYYPDPRYDLNFKNTTIGMFSVLHLVF